MDAKKLEILMTAIDLGSFSKAAEAVGYTQSGLTHLADVLEREIGVRLLNRTHSGVTLTEEGKELLPAIRTFLKANANLENQISLMQNRKNDQIRIAAYASIAMHWMPEILYRFRRICPDTTVELRMVDHALEPFELLEEGKTDVIFASRQNYDGLLWIPLYDETMYAILPKSYPLNGRTVFPLEEFRDKDFLMPYGRFDINVNEALQKVGINLKTKVSRVDDETVIRMVGRGLGVSMMTELMIRGRTDDVYCLPVDPPCVRELGMGISAEMHKSESITKLTECVTRYISEIKR